MDQQTKGDLHPSSQRITHLDTVRGVAVMGILIMNAVSFFFLGAAYFDISSPENKTILDWLIGGFGEVFADQKFMALFSLLFGASVLLFCERAEAKGHSPQAESHRRMAFGFSTFTEEKHACAEKE